MLWGAWYSGVRWHSPFSWAWIKATLNPRIPLWSALALVLLALIIPRLKVKRSLPPRVEGFWHLRNCYWLKDPYHQDVILRSLEGMFTLRDSYQGISIIRAYFKGGRAADSLPEPLYLETDSPTKFTFRIASSPVEVAAVPLIVTLILVDSRGREYEMPPVTARQATDGEVLSILSGQM